MSAPAAAFVAVGQFFSRWSTPFENVDTGQPVLPGSNTPGTSVAAAVPASARVISAAATAMSRFMMSPLNRRLTTHISPSLPPGNPSSAGDENGRFRWHTRGEPSSPAVRPARIRAVSLSDYSSVRAPAPRKGVHLPQIRIRDDTRHALPVVVAVVIAGIVGLGLAVASVVSRGLGWNDVAGICVLLAAATVAEAFPFPIEGVAAGWTSLATILLVAVAALYGWAVAGIVGFLTMALVEVGRRRPFSRVAFNCAVYVLAGIAAGGAAAGVADGTLLGLVLAAASAAASFWLVDITLLAAVVSRSRQTPLVRAWRNYVLSTSVPFAIMASLSAILVVLWNRSPYVAVILVVPLLATALYQRWIHGALERLREFDRLKDEFIAVVSHELRTPLTSVYGAALTLRQQKLDDQRRNTLLDIVSTEAARLGRLLDDVLWVSRLDSDRADAFIDRVDALEAVTEV